MDLHSDVACWLRKMGYNGPMPESLVGICNNSTSALWEQLLQNVRPRNEVQTVRRNIILNRLKMKPLKKQDDFPYKMDEIEHYKKKLVAEQTHKTLEIVVQEKRNKVEQMSQQCRLKDVSIDFLQKQIEEAEERKFLLDGKRKLLENQNFDVQETLRQLKNVTPVEREESCSLKDVTELLEKCAEKLNNLYMDNLNSRVDIKTNNLTTTINTVKKRSPLNKMSGALYHSMLEKKMYNEIAESCRKQSNIIEKNVHRRQLETVKHRLFDAPEIIVEDATSNSDNLAVDLMSTPPRAPKSRESLGLLPDSCLDEVESNDSFLKAIGDTLNTSIAGSIFDKSSPISSSSGSVVFNFKVPEISLAKKQEKRAKLYSDAAVNKELEKLLHSNNRELIYESLQKCMRQVNEEFIKLVSMHKDLDAGKNKVNQDDIAKLRFIHVQMELKILKQKRTLKELMSQIARQRLHLLSQVRRKEYLPEIQQWLDAQIKRVAIDATLDALKKEVVSSDITETDDNDLQVLSSKIAKVKNDISHKLSLIQLTIDELYAAQKSIATTRESVLGQIWHLKMFRLDTDWMNPLIEDRWTEEVKVFENFPLAYQKRCVYTEPKAFYRDMCVDNYPDETEMDPETLQMISDILESPFSPPETILLSLIKAKIKMDALKSIKSKQESEFMFDKFPKNYSFEELQKQESYIEFAIERLKSVMFSSNAAKTLSVGTVVKEAMEVWMEMPMKDFISDKRLLDGHNFKYYENKLNEYLLTY